MSTQKKIVSAVLFLALMTVTFFVIFKDINPSRLMQAIREMQKGYLALAVATAISFVSMEGILLYYLFRQLGEKPRFLSCIGFSFIGFFYSGITPSASGGQPMQLYYMKKSGCRLADSTVVLMSVAIAYKVVLVLMGIGICIFWWGGLRSHLGDYLPIYFLGLFLNTALIVLLLSIMILGTKMEKLLLRMEDFLVRHHLMKASGDRKEKIHSAVVRYAETVAFLKGRPDMVGVLFLGMVVQRICVFALTYFVYRGMGLSGVHPLVIMSLQAVVYIAVDMYPFPGSQGITEIMYAAVFGSVFAGNTLPLSMCISRGLNFYLLLLIGACVSVFAWWRLDRKKSAASG